MTIQKLTIKKIDLTKAKMCLLFLNVDGPYLEFHFQCSLLFPAMFREMTPFAGVSVY